jgi:hypothetical protein
MTMEIRKPKGPFRRGGPTPPWHRLLIEAGVRGGAIARDERFTPALARAYFVAAARSFARTTIEGGVARGTYEHRTLDGDGSNVLLGTVEVEGGGRASVAFPNGLVITLEPEDLSWSEDEQVEGGGRASVAFPDGVIIAPGPEDD